MGLFVDVMYTLFASVAIYFTLMFFVLYFDNKEKLFKMPKMKKFPSLSVLIPAYNEEDNIKETIENVKKMKYPKKFEVLVINDGSTDKTKEIAEKIAKKFKNVKVLNKENGGKANALNYGLKRAKGKIIGVVDADSCPGEKSLINAVPFFTKKKIGAVTTSIFVRNPERWIEKLQRIEYIMIVWARKLLECIDSVYVTPGVLSLYRKKALEEVGGFDEKNMTEDIEIAWRLMYHGYDVKMSLNSENETKVPKDLKSWWKQRIRWNVGGMQTWFKYVHTFLKKDYRSLGMFILPFFTFSYILSLLGLGLIVFIVGKSVLDYVLFSLGAYSIGVGITMDFSFMYIPDIFTIFGITIFVISMVWINISFRTVNKKIGWPKGLLDLVLYLTIYITIFPFNLIHSSIKFLRGSYEW